jgi:DNA-binding LytR/AlgR family response regulator
VKARAVIAEDEGVLRAQLEELLHAAWPELEIVVSASDGAQALAALEAHHPDVLFLDIQMPEASGLEVATRASNRCHVVFITAYDQYAVAAFEQGAVDYVMKPLSGARVATAVARVKERMRAAPANLEGLLAALAVAPRGSGSYGYLRWINVSRGDEVQLVTTDEVLYFQSDLKYTRVVTRDGEGLIRRSIRDLLEELDPSIFWQVHRSTVVNLNAIAAVTRDLAGHVVLRLKERKEVLQVSQTYAHLFRQM